MTKPLPAALRAPVTNLDQAYAYIKGLIQAELMYHFDDGAADCLSDALEPSEAKLVGQRVGEIYDLYDWGQDICPIGIALMLDGFDGYTTYDKADYQLRGQPTADLAIICYDAGGVVIADRYCSPDADETNRFEVSAAGVILGTFPLFEDALSAAKAS